MMNRIGLDDDYDDVDCSMKRHSLVGVAPEGMGGRTKEITSVTAR